MTESDNPSAIRSKKEITEALISLMKEHPYREITVKQIVLEARIAKKTFYRNFDSKDDVLISMIKGVVREYYDIINRAESDVLSTIFTFADRYRDMLLLLDRNSMLHIPLQCINEYLPVLHERSCLETNPSGKLYDGLDESYLMAMNHGAIWNVITLWVHSGMKDDPEYVKQTLIVYLKRIRMIRDHDKDDMMSDKGTV